MTALGATYFVQFVQGAPFTAILPDSIHRLATDQGTSASVRTTASRARPPRSLGTIQEASEAPRDAVSFAGDGAAGEGLTGGDFDRLLDMNRGGSEEESLQPSWLASRAFESYGGEFPSRPLVAL
jgi:hypothetical protein